jgi:hypothetical protein
VSEGSDKRDPDPLGNAAEGFEQHEKALLEEAMARMQRSIPEGATVGEAIAAMQRAMLEDDDARELLMRTAAIQLQNRGYINTYFEELAAKLADPQSEWTAERIAATTGKPLSGEELDLMSKLREGLERQLPDIPDVSQREARIVQLLKEDRELGTLASRLARLALGGGTLPPGDRGDPGGASR